MATPRVLITGFGPFPGVLNNPSAWLVEALAARPPLDCNGDIHVRILPTAWEEAALMPRFYARLQPHVMIHFGVSERAKAVRIERSAHNRAASRPDAKGALPATTLIREQGPDRFDTRLPAAQLAARLKTRGLPAVASRSAGSYLCNFLYYHSLGWALAQTDPRIVLFVHIPPLSTKGGPFGAEALLAGAQEILSFVFASVDRHAQAGSSDDRARPTVALGK